MYGNFRTTSKPDIRNLITKHYGLLIMINFPALSPFMVLKDFKPIRKGNHVIAAYLNTTRYCLTAVFVALVIELTGGVAFAGTEDLFVNLRGKWKGSGTMTLKDGKQRLICDAQYSGTATQLRLAINCKSDSNKISMNGQLSANQGNLLGTWREETYNAIGTISGKATDKRIKFYIGGNVLGTMLVRFTKRSQNVTINASNVSLKNVQIKMKRR